MPVRYRGTPLPSRRPRRGPVWRVLFWLLVVLALPPLAWLVWNRIDEAPNADALRWGAPVQRVVADADNAWLYFLGIGAAADDDPIAFGRRRVDAYLAQAKADPDATPAAPPVSEPLPYVATVAGSDGPVTLCSLRDADCIAWAAQHRAVLDQLAAANAVQLRRYAAALDMTQWQEAPLVSMDYPITTMTVATLELNLLALAAGDSEKRPALVAEIARRGVLWRRVAEQSEWLISKILAFAFAANGQRIAVEIYARATPAQRAQMDADIDALLAAPGAAETSLEVLASEHFRTTSTGLQREMPGLWRSLRNCMRGTPKNGSCSKDLAFSATFLPQATTNIVARLDTAMNNYVAAMPADEAAAAQRYAELVERENPMRDTRSMLAMFARNGSGKVLAFIAIPKAHWRKRLNDYEMLRRALLIRVESIRMNVAAADMAAFLAAQPPDRRHPYPDKAFRWDAEQRAIVGTAATPDTFRQDELVVPCNAAAAAAAASTTPTR